MIRNSEGFLEGSFVVDVVERQHDTVDSDSDISLDEGISNGADHDENDMYSLTEIIKTCIQKKILHISTNYWWKI